MLSQLPRRRNLEVDLPKLQRVITPSRVYLLFLHSLSLCCSALVKMTRFGFLSLALLSFQAFVGTGLAAVSFSLCALRVTSRRDCRMLDDPID